MDTCVRPFDWCTFQFSFYYDHEGSSARVHTKQNYGVSKDEIRLVRPKWFWLRYIVTHWYKFIHKQQRYSNKLANPKLQLQPGQHGRNSSSIPYLPTTGCGIPARKSCLAAYVARLLRDFEASKKPYSSSNNIRKEYLGVKKIAQLPLLYSNLCTENWSAQSSPPLPEVRVHGSEILAVCLGGDAPMGSRPRLGPSPLRLPCAGLGVGNDWMPRWALRTGLKWCQMSGSVELVACFFFEQLGSSIDDQQKY